MTFPVSPRQPLNGNEAVAFSSQDIFWMQQALAQAQAAAEQQEVPVGAVLVQDNQLIGAGRNCPISACDPSAHAEIMALRQGAECQANYRLINTTLYVTLEPCIMCLGAIVHARVQRVVFGANDPKAGAVHSAFQLGTALPFNHRVHYQGGLMAEECGRVLQEFFWARR